MVRISRAETTSLFASNWTQTDEFRHGSRALDCSGNLFAGSFNSLSSRRFRQRIQADSEFFYDDFRGKKEPPFFNDPLNCWLVLCV